MKATKQELKRLDRLVKRSDFVLTASEGKKWVAQNLILQVKKIDTDQRIIGFTVTKKQGNAVIRNRIKRRLRAAVADIFPQHAQSGYNYVVIGRQNAFDADADMLRKDLIWCLKRLECLQE